MIRHIKKNIIETYGITKNLDESWAPGSNQGCLDADKTEAHTHYYIYLIEKTFWNKIKSHIKSLFKVQYDKYDILASKYIFSVHLPVLPTGYKKIKSIGSIITDEKSNIIPAAGSILFFRPELA